MSIGRRNLVAVGIVLALLLAACSSAADDTTTSAAPGTTPPTSAAGATTTTTDGTETTTTADVPTELSMALLATDVIDDPWYTTMLDAMERTVEAQPYGLDVTYEWFENIAYADGERIIRDLAVSGKYDIIVAHSTYSDAVNVIRDEFPEIAFVFSGAGNEPTGGNGFWISVDIHESGYLSGVVAGLMTQSDKIGVVANFPFPDVNAPVNGFIAGAKSVNPEVEATIAFIESWWDPVKTKESALAQIAAGADVLYSVMFGALEAASEAGVYGIGDYEDQQYLAPDAVVTSNMAFWDPALNTVIDAWWNQQANGVTMNAPLEQIRFSMADGGADIAPLNDALVPDEVRTAVTEIRDKILSGELVVELNEAPPE